MGSTNISINDIKQRVIQAICALYRYDGELLEYDANERSITHKLAEHLQREFPEWNVDCEYNRREYDVKRLRGIFENEEDIKPDDTESRTIFPDVIVHKRGLKNNLVVIEIKKQSGRSNTKDVEKLKAFTLDEAYQYYIGLFLVVGKPNERAELRVFKEGYEVDLWSDELNDCLEMLGYGE